MNAWVLASRPKTLTISFVPILVGAALASALHGKIEWGLSISAFLSAVFIQIGTNLVNDALDFEKGADNSDRLGPPRATQMGLLSGKQVLRGGLACFFLSALLAIPIVIYGGWPIFWVGLFSLAAGYAYTGGPFPLSYFGVADFFVLIFFGWAAVGGVYYLNTGRMDIHAWVGGSQIGLLATVVLAIANLRDIRTDSAAGKRTLAVRFGVPFAKVEILSLCLFPFLGSIYWAMRGLWWAACLPFLVLPLGMTIVRKVLKTDPGVLYNGFLIQAVLLHLSFGILLSLGLFLK